jgi:acyl-coenzyme A synthetase/AMP-(fatty) acid ligase
MNWIKERFQRFGPQPMAIGASGTVTYAGFVQKLEQCGRTLREWGIAPGDRVGFVPDQHIDAVALLLALMEHGCVVVLMSEDDRSLFDERLQVAGAGRLVTVSADPHTGARTLQCRDLAPAAAPLHPLLAPMAAAGAPGLVIFTSGSTGRGKAVLWDFGRLTRPYRDRMRESMRTLLFYKLDHMGGLDTLFYVMFNGGTVVTCPSRQARDVCACIEQHAVELLPATPSFLTMLLISGVYRGHDLSSLKAISYGTEVMPQSTLAGLHQAFPGVALKQTYGLSELGVLATRSRDSSSRWMKMGGQGLELKVKDGTLRIRSRQAMLGYLNAPSPFDEEGWYDTGDRVEVDGEYFRVLGRESEVINVAGEKVFPSEVESVLLTLDNVRDVIVRSKKSPVVGQMIWAEFLLQVPEEPAPFRKRVVEHCQRLLAPFKVPGFITIATTDQLVGSRFKKIRRVSPVA